MLRIENTIFSLDILEKQFLCDIPRCLGNCCRYGDAGAPLGKGENKILKKIWPAVKGYLRPGGIIAIEQQGTSVRDHEGDIVTPLIEGNECAYTIIEDNIYKCGIEKAHAEGRVPFKKPLSCHLYPVRIKRFSGITAVNYDVQPVCSAARSKGQSEGIYVYEFLKEPLIRALGEHIYGELCIAAEELRKQNLNI
ncbi:MAG TPA: DUF3109 family protein [Bacteroidales bacterium]|jgi:hypothetical protein|nr:DUF3109 family protein [Bacteroidales bacterium]